MTDPDNHARLMAVGQTFTPGSPINERDLFAGRIEQFDKILETVSQRGYHAVLYGERGVGKTSLANVIAQFLTSSSSRFVAPRVNCDAADDFSSLWRKALQDIAVSRNRSAVGFTGSAVAESQSIVDQLPRELAPDDIRRVLTQLSAGITLLVIFDEFDRLADKKTTVLMADTIKSLSDYAVNASIMLIGVADSVDRLIEGHQSIERGLIQIPMPRMSPKEIEEIVRRGTQRLDISVGQDALDEIVSLSQGLPYITHLLALYSVRAAISDGEDTISPQHVDVGIKKALDQWQQSIKTAYYEATRSPQPGNIYREVLLACALAEIDDLGYFTAASVRIPLRVIADRPYDIPNFARHLKEFSEAGRGEMLERVGQTRRLRYRFVSPIMRPYIVMRGFAEGLLSKRDMAKLANIRG